MARVAHALLGLALSLVASADQWTCGYHMHLPNLWMNDPIPTFDTAAALAGEDQYHMFCLCNPASTASPFLPGGQQGWCHAHSPDMMTHWTIEQPALPGPHAPGTGNIILLANANGSAFPATTYGGVAFTSGGLAALSGSKDILLVNWTMSSAQPLIPAPPPTKTNVTLLGDVSVAGRVNSGGNHVWTMVVGSSSAPVNGTTGPVALFYESMDLKNWLYISELYHGPSSGANSSRIKMECPMYIGAGDGGTHTLIYSSPDAGLSYWMLGTESIDANGVHFNPSAQGPIDFGGVYSAKAFQDDTGRWILFGWVPELQANASSPGIQTLPREMVLGGGMPLFPPAGEVSLGRGAHYQYTGVSVNNGTYDISAVGSSMYNLKLAVNINAIEGSTGSSYFAVEVLRSDDGEEFTTISVQQSGNVSCASSEMTPNVDRPGNDISGTPVSGSQATPEWCRSSCCSTSGCMAWTFVQSQPNDGRPFCWLKDTVGPTNPAANMTSGVVSGTQALLTVDTRQSSLSSAPAKPVYTALIFSSPSSSGAAAAAVGDAWSFEWDVDIYVDRSVVEVYANGGAAVITARVYPTLPDSINARLVAVNTEGAASVDVFEMNPALMQYADQ